MGLVLFLQIELKNSLILPLILISEPAFAMFHILLKRTLIDTFPYFHHSFPLSPIVLKLTIIRYLFIRVWIGVITVSI